MIHKEEYSDKRYADIIRLFEMKLGGSTGGKEIQKEQIYDMENTIMKREKDGASHGRQKRSLFVSIPRHEEFYNREKTNNDALKPISKEEREDTPSKRNRKSHGEKITEQQHFC
jgi:hypothetical protein